MRLAERQSEIRRSGDAPVVPTPLTECLSAMLWQNFDCALKKQFWEHACGRRVRFEEICCSQPLRSPAPKVLEATCPRG